MGPTRPRFSIFLAMALLAATRTALATDSTWTSIGPYGGGGRVLAPDPTAPGTLYAGGGSVFRNTDRGDTWTRASLGLVGSLIRALAVDPTAPATVYACTDSFLFKT